MQISKIKNLIEQNKSGAGELVIVEGLHAVKHALRFKGQVEVLLTKDKAELIRLCQKLCPDLIEDIDKLAKEISEADFDNLTVSQIRTGLIGIFKKPEQRNIEGSAVLLDDPKDLDNIGAVVRVTAAANIRNLLVTGASNPWNYRAIRAGAGLQFALNIQTLDYNDISSLKLPTICFDERGDELDKNLTSNPPKQAIYVFGSERDGISEELKKVSQRIIRLPMRDGVSSMNLATSVAAALYSLR